MQENIDLASFNKQISTDLAESSHAQEELRLQNQILQ